MMAEMLGTQAKPMQTEANSSNNNSTNLRNSINSSNSSSQQQNNQTTAQQGAVPKSKLGTPTSQKGANKKHKGQEPAKNLDTETDAACDEEGKRGKKPPRK
jgi:hypothetical protein